MLEGGKLTTQASLFGARMSDYRDQRDSSPSPTSHPLNTHAILPTPSRLLICTLILHHPHRRPVVRYSFAVYLATVLQIGARLSSPVPEGRA